MRNDPSDPPELDLARILETLDRHGVSYLIVGGIAAAVYGASRSTTDFDCMPARDAPNLQRLADTPIDIWQIRP